MYFFICLKKIKVKVLIFIIAIEEKYVQSCFKDEKYKEIIILNGLTFLKKY